MSKLLKCRDEYYTELNGVPTGVSLFLWLPEERARWVEMRAKRDRAIRAITAANPHHENPYTRASFRSRHSRKVCRRQHRPAAEDEDARSILTSFWAEYVVQETPSGWLLEAARPDRTGKAGNPRTDSHRTRTKPRPLQERSRRRACMR